MSKINTLYAMLRAELGDRKVTDDPDILEKYSHDETPDAGYCPDILVRAETALDVSRVLQLCSAQRVPVTPRGAGSGVTGGAVPVQGGVVLSLERLNRILEIDTENMIAVVEPGAITGDIQKAAGMQGLMYPPDPASLEQCSIGGNVAENAGGPRAVKYGTTKDYVLGLEFVLPDGSIISAGGKIVKDVTGYNLIGIILGSEGTLAVITKIYLRLIPAPRVTIDILIPFPGLEQAIDAVCGILQQRIVPAALEFMEEDAIRLVGKHLNQSIPFPDAGAHLLLQLDGGTEETVYRELETIHTGLRLDQEKIFVAVSPGQKERLWRARRSIREALRTESPVFLAEDCVVPRSRIPVFLSTLKKYFAERGLRSIMFGHAGDGNVHIDVLKGDLPLEDWSAMLPEVKRTVYQQAIDLGGTITGEHGVGHLRRKYLPLLLDGNHIALMQRIKRAFDPELILNPGKIFP